MKRRIVVTIDAKAKTCWRCTYKYCGSTTENGCDLWDKVMKHDNRCHECLAAEKAYKEATHD